MSIMKIDVDYKAPEDWLHKWEKTRILILEKYYQLHVLRVARHNTTKGQNFFIEVKEELTAGEINELQFMLGDDHTRVKINAWRIQRGIPHWNKIFDRKLWRKGAKIIECWYCGNKIPLINHSQQKVGKEVNATSEKEKAYKGIDEKMKAEREAEEKAEPEAEEEAEPEAEEETPEAEEEAEPEAEEEAEEEEPK